MADEIPGQNLIRVACRGPGSWAAFVGPDPDSGLVAIGPTPADAIDALAEEVRRGRWIFDPGWCPPECAGHDDFDP